MYKRDVAIVLISVFAIFFSVQHEGRISFRKAWIHIQSRQPSDPELATSRDVLLPAPVVSDLNGDGQLEVITATKDYHLQVLRPKPPGKDGDGFAHADVIATVSLLPQKVGVSVGRRPVALAVGFLDPEPSEKVKPLRKQVVVAVTAGWHVMCFDHNLRLMWEHEIEEKLPHHSHIAEAAIFIGSHQVNDNDRGLVVVGGSVALGDLINRLGMGDHTDAYGDDDVFEEELAALSEEQRHARSYDSRKTMEDVDRAAKIGGIDTSRHFSYFAFEGATGQERWTHEAGAFHKDLDELAEGEVPQHNFRLDATHLVGRHFGEASCRDYRESLLFAMPHVWTSPSDSRLEEAYFVRHKMGHGPQKKHLADTGSNVLGLRASSKSQGSGTGPFGKMTGGLTGSKTPAASPKSDRSLMGGATPTIQPHQHPTNKSHRANAIVAHMEEGLEVIHLFSGRTICQLHLPDHQLHVDLNGDGVLDHVEAYSGMDDAGQDIDGVPLPHSRRSHCTAIVTSGIPPKEPLFTAHICKHGPAGAGFDGEDLTDRLESRVKHGPRELELAPPAFLPLPNLKGSYGSKMHSHGLLAFMTSRGEISAYSSHGHKLWGHLFPTMWYNHMSTTRGETVPTLKAVALRPHVVPTAILAAGAGTALLLSEHGEVVSSLHLPHPPILPLQVVDFNGDGLNDIVLVTKDGLFGYAQVHHLGGFQYGALVLTLVISMAVVYYTQQVEGGKRGRKPLRSTEYTD